MWPFIKPLQTAVDRSRKILASVAKDMACEGFLMYCNYCLNSSGYLKWKKSHLTGKQKVDVAFSNKTASDLCNILLLLCSSTVLYQNKEKGNFLLTISMFPN